MSWHTYKIVVEVPIKGPKLTDTQVGYAIRAAVSEGLLKELPWGCMALGKPIAKSYSRALQAAMRRAK